ncbi:PrsW family intramembrane metalloprotease [Tessaracoccus antarcticus]|nr:PrsW family intramembrane metalloprotease [Tessaracoccus antarcticus]
MTSPQLLDRQRWLSGLPPTARRRPWWQRMLHSPLFWLTVVLVPFYAYCLLNQYQMLHPDREFADGTVALGLNNEALRQSAFWAMWTALAYVVLFVWLDRFRAQRPLVWLLTFLWGACAATWISIHVNTWAAEAMNTTSANADMGTRAAIFIAPFVEEASKATVLFLLVVLFRARIVSRLSIVTLAGLSAIGFAFVENIIYYARVFVYANNTIEVTDPQAEVLSLVMLRGVYTSFGHPVFTMMTALGLAIALGTRSKIVRVAAPLGGFVLACGGHMLFNGVASSGDSASLRPQWFMALGLVATLILMLVFTVVAQTQLIRRRLGDYRRVGWLTDRDPVVFSSPFKRMKLQVASLLRGPRRTWLPTTRFMRRISELAYLREGMTRGTIGVGGDDRAREILLELEELRPAALTDTRGLTLFPPRRRKPLTSAPPPQSPGPAGLGGNWPAP